MILTFVGLVVFVGVAVSYWARYPESFSIGPLQIPAIEPTKEAPGSAPQVIPSASSSDGWKVYRSREFGYSLAYPPNWRLDLAPAEERKSYWNDIGLGFRGPGQTEQDYLLIDGVSIQVWLFRNDEELTLNQWLHGHDVEWGTLTTVYQSSPVSKQGVQGVRRKESCIDCGGPVINYYFPLQELILLISINVAAPDSITERHYLSVAQRVYEHFRLRP